MASFEDLGFEETPKKAEKKAAAPKAADSFSKLGFEEAPKEKSTGDLALEFGNKLLDTYESVAKAPTRSALSAFIKGQGFQGAKEAFKGQFGKDPATAPSGEQLLDESGASKFIDMLPPVALNKKVAGQAVEMLADPGIAVGGLASKAAGPVFNAIRALKSLNTWENVMKYGVPAAAAGLAGASATKSVMGRRLERKK